MSSGPPLPALTAVEQARDSARRQARSLSGGLVMVLGVLGAVGAVVMYAVLDYGLGQDPHRLVKITLGAAVLAGIVMKPRVGLFLIPIMAPFLLWLPKLPLPGLNTLNILLGSVFLSYALGRVLQRQPLFRNGPVGTGLMLMLLMSAVWIGRGAAFPTGYEYDALGAGVDLFRQSMIFGMYFVTLAMTRGDRERRMITWAIVLGLLLEAVMTIKLGRNFRGRAAGSIDQPNDLGTFLAMFTPLAAALFFAVRSLWARALLGASVIAGCVAVMLTISRGGLIAMALALGYVAIRSSRMLSILLVAALLTSPAWAPDYVKDRITGTQIAEEGTDELELEGSSADRVETWRTIGNLVMDHPLDGVGYFGLQYVLASLGSTLSTDIKDTAHNTYLRFLGEMGIFGLALFVWILWTCWKLHREGHRSAATPFERQMAIAYGAAVLALAFSCMFGDRFSQVTIGGNFWVFSALMTDLVQQRRATQP